MQPQPVQPTGTVVRPEVGVQTASVNHQDQSDLRDFLQLIRRYALLIACFAVATCLATYFFSASQQKQYAAHSTILYTPTDPAQDPTRALSTMLAPCGYRMWTSRAVALRLLYRSEPSE